MDPTLSTYQQTPTFHTEAAHDFTHTIPLSGLKPETKYYLNVVVNGAPQLPPPTFPSFTTFPPAGSSRDFNFVCFSDFATTKSLSHSVSTYASAASLNPAFVFIGGDFDHRNPQDLPERREMFQDLYNPATPFMEDFVKLILRQFPITHQWDDHDAGQNNVDRTFPDWSLTQQVYQEYIPSYPLPSVNPGIWQRFSYAQVDGFVLDCRSQRDPEGDPDDANKSMLDGNNLGATGQLQWLENGLLTSAARWKVIFTSVIANTTTKYPDGWAGYQTEWNQLKTFINSNHIDGVVFISGDLHLGAIDNGSLTGFPEMCILQPNGLGDCPTSLPGVWSEGYFDEGCSGFGVVKVSQNPDSLTLEAVNQDRTVKLAYTLGTPPPPPVITAEPQDVTVPAGHRATFSVTATGTPPLFYKWEVVGGGEIPGADTPSYTTHRTTPDDSGRSFQVLVSNPGGTVTSDPATLTVTP